jgi:hypothetical protein
MNANVLHRWLKEHICWWDCPPSNLRRSASLSLRISILKAGMKLLAKNARSYTIRRFDLCATPLRRRIPPCRLAGPFVSVTFVGISGHFPEIAGHVGPEYSLAVLYSHQSDTLPFINSGIHEQRKINARITLENRNKNSGSLHHVQ